MRAGRFGVLARNDYVLTNRAFVHNVSGMRSFMDDHTEIDKNKSHKLCNMRETDETGIPNLCCCYIVDADGKYQDPCYHPTCELISSKRLNTRPQKALGVFIDQISSWSPHRQPHHNRKIDMLISNHMLSDREHRGSGS